MSDKDRISLYITLSMQNQEDKSLDQWKISVWGLLVIQYQMLQTNIIGIVELQ